MKLSEDLQIFYHDIWFDVSKLTYEDKLSMLLDAYNYSIHAKKAIWHVDILDPKNDAWPARKKIDMPFNEIIDKLNDECHFVVVYRRGYTDWKNSGLDLYKWKLEIGFCTMSSPDYFLWMYIDEDLIQYFERKFNLIVRNY